LVQEGLGNVDEALSLYKEDLASRRRLLTADDPDLHNSVNSLGTFYATAGQNELALPLMQEALAGFQRVLGRQHPGSLTVIGNLGRLHCRMGAFDAGLLLLEEAAAGMLAEFGMAHLDTRFSDHWVQCAKKRELGPRFSTFRAEQETMYERRAKRPRRTAPARK
jgi:tetratricopeptide (TPR) repeat protein